MAPIEDLDEEERERLMVDTREDIQDTDIAAGYQDVRTGGQHARGRGGQGARELCWSTW